RYTVRGPLYSAARYTVRPAIQCGPLYSAARYTVRPRYTVRCGPLYSAVLYTGAPLYSSLGQTFSQHRPPLWLSFRAIQKPSPIHGALYAEPTRTTVEIRNARQPTPG